MPDFTSRRARAFTRLGAGTDYQALLVTDGPGVAWLTGFSGSNGSVLLTGAQSWLATDGRYREQAAAQSPGVELLIDRRTDVALLTKARELGVAAVAVASDYVTLAMMNSWRQASVQLAHVVAIAPVVDALRVVKDAREIETLREACRISTVALTTLVDEVRVGMTELSLARRLEQLMGQAGADDRAFPTIVATGSNSAIPHHEPTDRAVASGDLLKIDFGARVAGYHADCTRTFVVGADPQDWQLEIHGVVARAAAAGRTALQPGAEVAAVDAVARGVIAEAGYAEQFSHGLGHGVGLQIHEAPLFAAASVGTLAEGVVATIEPGIYLAGRGGVRIEDTCLVADGGPVPLTTASRELIRLD
ncbi:MAG: Xaa-Pro peptidase family protein [Candidatus Nanopelagicales bacterium]